MTLPSRELLQARMAHLERTRIMLQAYPIGSWTAVDGTPWHTATWLRCINNAIATTQRDLAEVRQ